MKLIGSLTSPFVHKVRIVAAEKHVEYDFQLDVPWEADTQVPQFNPLGKVPVWVLEDGKTLFDSRVIVEYLDTVTPNNRLIPASGRQRILVKRWEALADGVCGAAAAAFLEAKRPEDEKSPSWITRLRDKVVRSLEVITEELGENPWCFGNAFSLADIAVGTALGYLDFRFPDIDWKTQHPSLGKLYGKLMQGPSFQHTAPRD